jgi:hypothetical protein
MPEGFAPRFALEAGFLVLLGVGAGVADLRPIVIVAVLAAGWLLVSMIELAVWISRSRSVITFVAPQAEPEPEPGPESRSEHGWPVEMEEESEPDSAYPLRADAGSEPSDEVEAYTRVLEAERDAPAG